jgi:hypothetical protein
VNGRNDFNGAYSVKDKRGEVRDGITFCLKGDGYSVYGIRAYNVPAVWKPLTRQSERFGGPDRKMRSIFRADKLWRRFGVGMSEAIDLAKP